MGKPRALKNLNTGSIGKSDVAACQDPAVKVPVQIPVRCQPDDRDRRIPQLAWDTVVGQSKHQAIGLPVAGKLPRQHIPAGIDRQGDILLAFGVEEQVLGRGSIAFAQNAATLDQINNGAWAASQEENESESIRDKLLPFKRLAKPSINSERVSPDRWPGW